VDADRVGGLRALDQLGIDPIEPQVATQYGLAQLEGFGGSRSVRCGSLGATVRVRDDGIGDEDVEREEHAQ